MQMLFLVMAGALALAGMTASLIFRFGRARAKHAGTSRRPARDLGLDPIPERSSPSMFPNEDTPIWRRQCSALTPRAIRARPTIRSGG